MNFIPIESLQSVIKLFKKPNVQIGSLMIEITDEEKINNPNCVKVVVDIEGRALYFSRAAIPYSREKSGPIKAFQHIGVYAFRKQTLLRFTQMPMSSLEAVEKLENLRMLENGIPIHLATTQHVGISIDTEEDFAKATAILKAQ
jgi:3-deoxy-manno-octulosonate cytidylyltransferase (CMP-KDO synthetase)